MLAHQKQANFATYLVYDFSAYRNEKVLTINGGQRLKEAIQFNLLEAIPEEMWDQLKVTTKAKRNK